ncbi:MAG: flagellar hook-associated protein FlgL [Candidatus Melainabacteria bacterium]
MSMNRITAGLMNDQSLKYLNLNMKSLSDIQERLSSGRNINRPSDDPVGLTRILNLANDLKTDNRYKKNVENGQTLANTADTAINNMVNLVHRVQELTTQAANVANNQDGRNAIALEVDQIIDQLVQLANTNVGGKYIFAGLRTDQPPYVRSASALGGAQAPPINDLIVFNGTPLTEPWQQDVEIARGVTMTLNINGDALLGNTGAGLTAAVPPLTPGPNVGGSGLFHTLSELLVDLRYPDPAAPDDQLIEIRNRLDDLTSDLNTVLAQQAVVGAVVNRLDLTSQRIQERNSVLTNQFADIQNIDMAETIANLNNQQNMYQASLGVTARVVQTTLLNYLR